MADSLQFLLSCQICLEDFEEDGDLIPRILPCSHTLCERCLIQLLGGGGGSFKCPECRAQHAAPSKEKSFPQNKYLLTVIKRRESREEEPEEDVSLCPDHGKELTLFCKETQCQTLICTVCMTRKHKKHDVVDVDENRKEELLENLTSAIETLSCWEEQIDAVQITVETKNEESLRKLREDKKRTLIMVGKMYDSLIDAVATQAEEFSSRNGNKMASLKENLLLLNHMKLHMEPETVSQRDVENYQETRDSITEQTHRTLFGAGSYEYLEYAENNEKERLAKLLCGELTRKDCTPAPAKITEQGRRAKSPTNLVENQETSPSPPAPPNFKLKWSIETRYNRRFMVFLSCGETDAVTVCGGEALNQCSVRLYSLLTGEERSTVRLEKCPQGMTTVLFENITCVILSYKEKSRIEFRPVGDLNRVVFSLPISGDPAALCTQAPSQLLYQNKQAKPYRVRRVDCSATPPTLHEVTSIVHDGREYVWRMCSPSRDLLVVTRYKEGVFCYTLKGGELKWKVSGKLPEMEWDIDARGVAADDHGHLFVCDESNRCVHLLYATDGAHLGVVVRALIEGVGKPREVAWHGESASLVVAHEKEADCYFLSVFSCQK